MNVLNLDALAEVKRTLTLGGKSYDVVGMTVSNFIATTLAAEKLEGEESTAIKIEATINMILRSIPDLEEMKLRSLQLEQLGLITKFLRGEMDGEKETEVATEDNEVKK